VENLIPKKNKIPGVAQNGSISAECIFRVANFGFNYLSHFFINFANSCAYLVANFLNFSKHPLTLIIWWFWRELWTKNQKKRCWKICHFEPTLKFNLFSEWDFSTFFLINMVQRYQNEIAPIFCYGIGTQTTEKDLKMPILQPPDWNHPYWMTLYQCAEW